MMYNFAFFLISAVVVLLLLQWASYNKTRKKFKVDGFLFSMSVYDEDKCDSDMPESYILKMLLFILFITVFYFVLLWTFLTNEEFVSSAMPAVVFAVCVVLSFLFVLREGRF